MYILHIETSTKICSVALSRDEELIDCLERTEGMNHTALLTPMISQLLKSASLKPGDLGAISVSSGPGSYTGLRVGSSTAKAMAYSLNIPLVSIPTLAALAWASFQKHPEADYALPMVDARRDEVYLSLYNKEIEELFPTSSVILDEGALSFIPENMNEEGETHGRVISSKSFLTICCGDGAFKLNSLHLKSPRMIVDEEILASAKHLVALAYKSISRNHFQDPMHFVPHYLKPPNITQQRKAQ
ncbi:MAG: tRNA (adenosine(37)-N6)-threonylcarbamoyltransferase complex dimerization subunit type 1 TsaB [Saprospiraceae bacterium]|uniref:tRNA (Adenosine(37)-N6)-threonylcarbamoyltransferase complex dimerization subunit type 1 TsaB n=1 Tax=Candidatus Opimibacter skivensis TaxID=2982028 RepID=A0A9D7SXA8_9BACT|nr:tRNA (adenosine(37)-N6)-threonylcarbamoyltransferase complex dimerization subunit type 1 TsaB [Candidatus Opimibacter skivensis]